MIESKPYDTTEEMASAALDARDRGDPHYTTLVHARASRMRTSPSDVERRLESLAREYHFSLKKLSPVEFMRLGRTPTGGRIFRLS